MRLSDIHCKLSSLTFGQKIVAPNYIKYFNEI